MPDFIFVYHGGGKPDTPEAGKAMMEAWMSWMGAQGDAWVDRGLPAGKSWTVSGSGVADNGGPNPITGFSVLRADSLEAALEVAKASPHITLSGGSIEVAQAMDMPM